MCTHRHLEEDNLLEGGPDGRWVAEEAWKGYLPSFPTSWTPYVSSFPPPRSFRHAPVTAREGTILFPPLYCLAAPLTSCGYGITFPERHKVSILEPVTRDLPRLQGVPRGVEIKDPGVGRPSSVTLVDSSVITHVLKGEVIQHRGGHEAGGAGVQRQEQCSHKPRGAKPASQHPPELRRHKTTRLSFLISRRTSTAVFRAVTDCFHFTHPNSSH